MIGLRLHPPVRTDRELARVMARAQLLRLALPQLGRDRVSALVVIDALEAAGALLDEALEYVRADVSRLVPSNDDEGRP